MIAIGEAARRSGVSVETIRYYEREGIVSKPARAENGRRLYGQANLAELRFVRRCRDLGFSISDARALRRLSEDAEASCADAEAVARRHLRDVRTKLAELRRLEAALAELVANCASGAKSCPILARLLADPGGA